MTEMKTLVCPGPPEHEFQIPKGRGRPPKYCEEHKAVQPKLSKKSEEKEVPETKPRPRPGSKSKSESDAPPARRRPPAPKASGSDHPGDQPVHTDGPNATMNESGSITRPDSVDGGRRRLPPPGRGDSGSRAKAENAHKRTAEMMDSEEAWPRGADGNPLARIEMAFAELIPTGQYANVSVGPARVTVFVDLSRNNEDMPYFTEAEKETITKSANELAEMMGRDVIGVQRNLVVESLESDGD